jgi:CheY-like chemotaxis protein
VFVGLREQTEQLARARMEHALESRRRRDEATNQQLAAYDRRNDGFIAILAHELRNPLAPLRTCIDLIRANPTEPLTARMIEAFDRQTRVLERLVDDLLDVTRIKADQIELRPEKVELAEVVEAALATSRPAFAARAHAVVITAPAVSLEIVADTVRLSQILCNILDNAARYTEPGGRIEITLGQAGDDATVSVRDNGIGIPHALQATMFSMFVQERVRSDGGGGLGLGLALSRRLVELHNGSIRAHSDGPNTGSTFTIAIPRAGSPLALAPKKRTADMAPLRHEPASRAVRTVVVDDNEDARELLSALLRQRGHEVLTAHDGPTGVTLILEHQPDVALVDLGLPTLDGFGVVETLRRQQPDLKTRLIALTGYGNADDYARTKQAGFHAHLVKPASSSAIVACVKRQLEDAE